MTKPCSIATTTSLAGNVALPYWQTLQKVAVELGVPTGSENKRVAETEEQHGISSVAIEHYINLLDKGLKYSADFGLRVGQSVTPSTYPVLGMTLLSCQNLHQVLEQVVRYESLNHDLGTSHFKLGADESVYSWTPNPLIFLNDKSELCFHLVLSVFTGIFTFAPWLVDGGVPIKRISFICAEPDNAATYQQFFNTEIHYNQPINSIVVASEVLSRPVLHQDSTAFYALTTYAKSLLESKEQNKDITHQLKAILPQALQRQTFRIEEVASQLNMSTRSLQRKLKELGQSYKTILDETRRSVAEMYLLDTTLSINEIAFLIGYQEQSSFNHAFKNWNGVSPSRYREQNSG